MKKSHDNDRSLSNVPESSFAGLVPSKVLVVFRDKKLIKHRILF